MEDDNVLMKYEELANKGDISSMLKLAKHFDYVQQDYQKAFFTIKKQLNKEMRKHKPKQVIFMSTE